MEACEEVLSPEWRELVGRPVRLDRPLRSGNALGHRGSPRVIGTIRRLFRRDATILVEVEAPGGIRRVHPLGALLVE